VAAKVIHEGVPGTAMGAWSLLTAGEIQAVTLYLRSFYQGPERHMVALPGATMEEHQNDSVNPKRKARTLRLKRKIDGSCVRYQVKRPDTSITLAGVSHGAKAKTGYLSQDE
jgi:hypothetical protein